jgi:hypothetical protein
MILKYGLVDKRIGINQGVISDVCNRITESIALGFFGNGENFAHFIMPAGKERRYFGRKKIKKITLLVLHTIPSHPVCDS